MYARIQRAGGADPDLAGAHEGSRLRRLAGAEDLLVSLWATQADAAADPTAEWYEVEQDRPGANAGDPAEVVSVVYFDGPLSPELRAAAVWADEERITPVMREHPGGVRHLRLWQPERRAMVYLVHATSTESLERGQQVITEMELLPGEDPALLPGADRVEVFRLEALPVGSGRR